MRIAYFITGLGLGGAEVVTILIAQEMVRRGHQIMLAYLTGDNAHKAIIDPTIEVIGLNMSKTPWGMIIAMYKTAKLLKRFNPDVVHSNMIHTNIFIRLLRIFVKMPKLICTEHSKNIEGKIRMLAYRLTDFLSDVNTNVSEEAVEFFVKAKAFKAKNSLTIYNGVDLSKYVKSVSARENIRKQYCIGDDEFLFINVGRLTPAKDQNNLIEALAKLDKGRLLILGKGDLQDVLKSKVAELGLEERVILAGAHSNVADYYSAADCFVLSSAWEGLPMVILEAMSFELPIITTDVGGAGETVGDQRWIVPTRDSLALSVKMDGIMALSLEERNVLGTENRIKASRFDLTVICDKWEEIYRLKDSNDFIKM